MSDIRTALHFDFSDPNWRYGVLLDKDSLDHKIGYAEAAGGEPLPPDASADYRHGWRYFFLKRDCVIPYPDDGE
jgi:hypothetical protein